MDDLDRLEQQVERASSGLRTSYDSGKERQTQIFYFLGQVERRLREQQDEMARLRTESVALTEANQRLVRMVHSLLGTIDAMTERGDDSVERIADMARKLTAMPGSDRPLSLTALPVDRTPEPDEEPAPAARTASPDQHLAGSDRHFAQPDRHFAQPDQHFAQPDQPVAPPQDADPGLQPGVGGFWSGDR